MSYREGWSGPLLAAAMTIAAAGASAAGEVVLKDRGGPVEIAGELIDFSSGFYRLRTDLGELRLSAERMECLGAACPETEMLEADLVFAGSGMVGDDLLPMLLSGWASARQGDATVTDLGAAGAQMARLVADAGFGRTMGSYLIRGTDTEDGLMQLAEGEAHVAMTDRRILPHEVQALRAAGAGNVVGDAQERVIAADPVKVIVHPSNPIAALSLSDLAGIYAGRVTNWRQLGGDDRPLVVYAAAAGSSARLYFEDRVLGAQPAAADLTAMPGDAEMTAAVSADPGAIGYVGHAFERAARAVPLLSTCGIATAPSGFAAKTGEYPLDRRFYLYAREDTLSSRLRDFFGFASSPLADGAIVKAGFVGMGVERAPLDAAAERVRTALSGSPDSYEAARMREYLDTVPGWERLSVTLRFDATSTRLDAQGRRDLERLSDWLARQPKDVRIALVGFTDDRGPFDGNRELSTLRAQQAAAEMSAQMAGRLDDQRVSVFGFGELAPVGCNATPEGRRANQRVEVWISNDDTQVVAAM